MTFEKIKKNGSWGDHRWSYIRIIKKIGKGKKSKSTKSIETHIIKSNDHKYDIFWV